MIHTIVAPIIVFAVIVLVHEFGHFIMAKLTGMKVEEFAIGFGPKICSVRYGETLYSLRILPLGGFNRIMGMDNQEYTDKRAFVNRPVWQKLLVVSAGAAFNILLAFAIFTGVIWHEGKAVFPDYPVIGEVISDTPAERAGLEAGDRILYIGKSKIDKWTDIHGALANAGNTVLEVQISRAGVRHTITVIPANRDGRTILGITAYVQVTPVSFTESLHMAADRCVAVIVGVGKGLMYIISGSPQGEVAGPIGIARIAGNVADTGILPLLLFIAILSLNLGVMNLLPIPLLDGGVIVLTVLEGLYGRKLPEKTLFYIQMAGIFILGGFFIYAMASDITALFR